MVIVIQCTDQIGLVAKISGLLAEERLNILSMHEYVDKAENLFFMRLEVNKEAEDELFEQKLRDRLPPNALLRVNPNPVKKAIIMVTKEYHCLADILIRNYFKTLGASVQCVIGNYTNLEDICKRFDIPFHHVAFENSTAASEKQILDIIDQYEYDYIVLAKFMRILSPDFVSRFPLKIINIHHSFLPAFAGANPYKQAYERGVKLVGATAHFVTDELDEGPIIAQQIISSDHSHTAGDMMKAGKEIETAVLAQALRVVFDDRVFIYKNKTVVLE
ncbi:formyltetrahydrofolate deformylase [Mucilaginibacter sp. McL0603]|uniref:formyltetrahydrofolate deformylase n=1 Tax=Mucilaginibacter sp. McL0603 TaxID=3415670 RepID=UPI003CEF6820